MYPLSSLIVPVSIPGIPTLAAYRAVPCSHPHSILRKLYQLVHSCIQPRALQHTNRVIHKELNMPLFDFHTLCHTRTTFLLEAGANPLYVQERLGHSRLAITWQYTHNTDIIRQQTHKILSTIYKSFTVRVCPFVYTYFQTNMDKIWTNAHFGTKKDLPHF